MGGRINARVDQRMSDTTCERAHILRQIINQDKSALTPEEGEGREGTAPPVQMSSSRRCCRPFPAMIFCRHRCLLLLLFFPSRNEMQRQKARFSLRSIRQLNPGGFLLREEKHLNKLRRGGEKSTRENPEFHEEIPPLPCLPAFLHFVFST